MLAYHNENLPLLLHHFLPNVTQLNQSGDSEHRHEDRGGGCGDDDDGEEEAEEEDEKVVAGVSG